MNPEEETESVDQYLRESYVQFLKDATLIHSDNLLTDKKLYSIYTYINVAGTFFAIASKEKNGNIKVNTFVRLGAGSPFAEKVEPIPVKAKILEMNE